MYHGTNSDIQKFSDEFVGKEEATDQEGPGIYFTTLKEESEIRLNGYWTPNRRQYINIRSMNNLALHRYFAVRINRTPIPEVKVPELNIHQLIASNKFMENLIEEQKIKMEAMEDKIRILTSMLHISEESKTEMMEPLTMKDLDIEYEGEPTAV